MTKTNEKSTLSKMDKVAEILGNKLNFNFASTKQNFEISFDEIPAESIAIILDYGTRKLNDKVNSLFANEKNTATREQLIERILGELKAGTFVISSFLSYAELAKPPKSLKRITALRRKKSLRKFGKKQARKNRRKFWQSLNAVSRKCKNCKAALRFNCKTIRILSGGGNINRPFYFAPR